VNEAIFVVIACRLLRADALDGRQALPGDGKAKLTYHGFVLYFTRFTLLLCSFFTYFFSLIMAIGNFIYLFHAFVISAFLLSGILIVSARGFKRPLLYFSLYCLIGGLLSIAILVQTSQTPIYGRLLWNPLHLLSLLTAWPLLYAYIYSLLHPCAPRRGFWLTAYIPPAALAMLYFACDAFYGTMPLLDGYADLRNFLRMPQLWIKFVAAAFSLYMICVYNFKAITLLIRHRRDHHLIFSYNEGSRLGWVWWVIGLAILKWLVVMTIIAVEGHAGQLIGLFVFIVEPVAMAALVVRQKDLYLPAGRRESPVEPVSPAVAPGITPGIAETEEAAGGASNGRNGLSPEKQALKQNLLSLLENNLIYTNPELNIETVCEMLHTNRTYLWQIINRDMNTTFYQLVNTYRVEKAAAMLQNPQHRNISVNSISDICGFKSLSAFSTFFKQTYGTTPTEWRKDFFQNGNGTE
jgi:AraC-like DNA-binding protein